MCFLGSLPLVLLRIVAGFDHELVLLRRFHWRPLAEENLFEVLLGRGGGLAEELLVVPGAALE